MSYGSRAYRNVGLYYGGESGNVRWNKPSQCHWNLIDTVNQLTRKSLTLYTKGIKALFIAVAVVFVKRDDGVSLLSDSVKEKG